ncbi:MAG: ATP-binding cassette domain-containing protein, partial [Planctomycetota bacterium]
MLEGVESEIPATADNEKVSGGVATAKRPGGTQTKLCIRHVSKSFKSVNGSAHVLEDINLEIREGEFVCIVGPSGCGKTTLLNIVAGLEKADSGEVWSNGHKVNGAGTDRVVIFQEAALFPWLNVVKNVEFGLKLKGINAKQ